MKIQIADRTLCRESNSFSFKEKIEISRQLEKLSADIIELPEMVNLKADSLLVKTVSSFVKNSIISLNAGMTKQSIEAAAAALANAEKPRLRIELPVSTVGMEYICHKKAPAMLEMLKELVSFAKQLCCDVEFCATDATRAEKEVLTQMLLSAAECGADTVTVCDTAALMLPEEFGAFISDILKNPALKSVKTGIACNNTNGLAAANSITAAKHGASLVKTDVLADNAPLETFAGIIKNCGEAVGLSSDIKYTELNRIVRQINWIISNTQNTKSVVASKEADNAVIKLDKNDSKETVEKEIISLGYDLSEEDIQKVYEEFLKAAESKNVGTKELDAIIASTCLQVPPTYKLVSYVVNSGNIIPTTAQITLSKDGKEYKGISFGDGSVDAAFLSIEQIIGHHYELDDFQIQSVTEGKEAMGSAIVKLRQNGKLYSGNGISTDIICAGIKAYLSAVNKIVYEEQSV